MSGGIPISELSGSDATDALHVTIKDFVKSSKRSTKTMIWLTWSIVALTIAMLGAIAVQILIALRYIGP